MAAFVGFFADMYDIYLPIIVLAPAIAYFEPPGLPAVVKTTLYYVVFVASLLGRPIGSFIFGHYGDRIGRKTSSLISIGGFGVCTLLIAVLPGYGQIGLTSVILLVILRLFDGVFLGGEYTAANPLAMEYSRKEKRGFNGGFITAGYAAANVAISVVTAIVLRLYPAGGIATPYVQWGWRIPFVIGVLISGFVMWYIWKRIPESQLWIESKKSEAPIRDLLRGDNGRRLLQVFVLMTGVWLVFDATAATLPTVLEGGLKVSSSLVTESLIIVNVVLFFAYLLFGALGQSVGRRKMLIWGGALNTVVTTAAYYYLIVSGYKSPVPMTVALVIIEALGVAGTLGIPLAYISERFPTSVRASGFGVGWSLAIIIPSLYAFYMVWLSSLMPYRYTQLGLVVIGGIIMVVGAAIGPETRDVEFTAERSV